MINSKIFHSHVPAPRWRTLGLLPACFQLQPGFPQPDLDLQVTEGIHYVCTDSDTCGQSNAGEIFLHWWLKSTCNKSLGNFPKNLKDLPWPPPVHHLLGLLKVTQLFEMGSSSGMHNKLKEKIPALNAVAFVTQEMGQDETLHCTFVQILYVVTK